MYQAGVRKITLYENTGISFNYYDANDYRKITALESLGQTIVVENMQQPDFEVKSMLSNSGEFVFDYIAKFFILGYNTENIIIINQLTTSINGWCALIEYYDNTYKFYNVPMFFQGSAIKPQKEMSFEMELQTVVATREYHFEYTPGISLVPVYRFDSTLITWDSELYTWDYEL